jgi:hypothetical protein
MKVLLLLTSLTATFFTWASPVFAQSNSDVSNFTSQTLNTLIIFATLGTIFFLIKGGYTYITSTGKPDALESAKTTIRNALIGLVLVLSAGLISSLLTNALTTPAVPTNTVPLELKPITPDDPPGGLTQVILDAVDGFLQNIVMSATKPLIDGIISFLTTTPSVVTNSVIFNFWLIMLGITNSLFILLVAVLGFQFMSASTFGFDEIEFKHLLPRIGLAFLGANSSIFLIDWTITLSNTLVNALIAATGGLGQAWVFNAVELLKIVTVEDVAIITLIFMLLFVILSALLLLLYIVRLITISLGAALSPFIFLLWATPKFSDLAEISAKTYIATIFTVFVHVVIIQLASAFLTIPEQVGTNSLISVLVAIGLLFTLLKTPSFMVQLMFYNTGRGMVRKLGGQIMNVITSKKEVVVTQPERPRAIRTPRKVVAA